LVGLGSGGDGAKPANLAAVTALVILEAFDGGAGFGAIAAGDVADLAPAALAGAGEHGAPKKLVLGAILGATAGADELEIFHGLVCSM
jgi:hypothetical protein